MNVFQSYLTTNNLDVQRMTSFEILDAFNSSGSTRSVELSEIAKRLPRIKELHVLVLRMEQIVEGEEVQGEHASDS